jgi:hypothetical protein
MTGLKKKKSGTAMQWNTIQPGKGRNNLINATT